MMCPKCGNNNCNFIDRTTTSSFGLFKACCGFIFLGPIGILCGLCGGGTNERQYWVCNNCGNQFQDGDKLSYTLKKQLEEESFKEKIRELNEKQCASDFIYDKPNESYLNKINGIEKIKSKISDNLELRFIFSKNSNLERKVNGLVFVTTGKEKGFSGEELAIAIIDISDMRDGTKGIILSTKGIYYSNNKFIENNRIIKMKLKDNNLIINTDIELNLEVFSLNERELLYILFMNVFLSNKITNHKQEELNIKGLANINNGGYVIEYKEGIIKLDSSNGSDRLIYLDQNNIENILLEEAKVKNLVLYRNNIYCILEESISAFKVIYTINRFDIVNKQFKKINAKIENVKQFIIYNDIIFIKKTKDKYLDGSILTIDLEGNFIDIIENKYCYNLTIGDGKLFYIIRNDKQKKVIEFDINTKKKRELYSDKKIKGDNIIYSKGMIYLCNSKMLSAPSLCSLDMNGSLKELSYNVGEFNISDDGKYIFFAQYSSDNEDKGKKLFRYNINNKNKEILTIDKNFESINIIKSIIYYKSKGFILKGMNEEVRCDGKVVLND